MAYYFQDFKKDFIKGITNEKIGPFSGRYIGGKARLPLWDNNDKFIELYNGLLSAYNLFYFDLGISFKDFAQVVMSECLQESTSDYNLWVGPISFDDGDAHGIIQATPQSVILDFHVWGQDIIDVSGNVILRTQDVKKWDLSHCTLCILIWAWYTRNTLSAGISLNEYGFRDQWYGQRHQGIKDEWVNFGNALYVWLGGPSNYREKPGNNQDYYLRVKDYYTQNFGTEENFEKIFNTKVPKQTYALNDKMNISSQTFSEILISQGSPKPGIREYMPYTGQKQRNDIYGLNKIGSCLVDKMTSKARHDNYPYGLNDREVKYYFENIYPIWNEARKKSGERQVKGVKHEWIINGTSYIIPQLK